METDEKKKITTKMQNQYTTEEDLLIMTGISHINSIKRSTRKHKSKNNIERIEFEPKSYKKVSELHNEVQETIHSLDKKIDAIIEKEEKEFLSAYRNHLMRIQHELNLYKAKLDDKEFQLKHDILLNSLEKSLDFFKNEAIRLAELASNQRSDLKKAEMEYEAVIRENTRLETQIKKAKKENKLLQFALRKAEDAKFIQTQYKTESIPLIERPSFHKTKTALCDINYHGKFSDFINCLRLIDCNREQIIKYCEKYYQLLSHRHDEIVADLKLQLNNERRISHKLRIAQGQPLIFRNELEQLFYVCGEEVRRMIVNNKIGKNIQDRVNKTMYQAQNKDEFEGKIYLRTSDKFKVMEQFMCNEKLLGKLYKMIFKDDNNNDMKLNKTQTDLVSRNEDSIFHLVERNDRRHRSAYKTKSQKYCIRNGKLCVKFPEVH